MKAAVMTQYQAPLEIQEVPDPEPGPADAVIRVENCGICRSDWHAWHGDWSVELPLIMGHELGGVVEAVGADISNFKPGDRVTVPFHMACGHCDYCYSGHSNICGAHGAIGFAFNGGFARLALVPSAAVNMVHLPDEVDFLSAAAIGCRFMTAYHGIADQARIRPADWLAVFGIGGVGLSAVQIATALGARVVAVDISDEKLELAKAEGAVATVNAAKDDPVEAVEELTGGGADISMDALGSPATAVPAVQSLRKGGCHVQIGLTTKAEAEGGVIGLPVDRMIFREIRFIGSFGCPTTSYPGLLALIANGTFAPQRLVQKRVALEEAGDVLASMTDFATLGFSVIAEW